MTIREVEDEIESVGVSWVRRYIARKKELTWTKPVMMEHERSNACTPSVIRDWYETLKEESLIEQVPPSLIANFDETMVQPMTSSQVKVVKFAHQKTSVLKEADGLPHITLGVTIFADGTHLDHLLIYPNKFVPQEVRGANAAFFQGYSIAGQDSGWISKELFAQHCRSVVIPAFEKRMEAARKLGIQNPTGIFIVDGHSSRLNSELINDFRNRGIIVLVLPAHTSHLLQPLDLRVFGVFKQTLSKGDSSLRKLTLPERRAKLLQKARTSLHTALSTDCILASFRMAGIVPFNPDLALQHPCVRISQEEKEPLLQENAKGGGERYNMGGKVITQLAEIEAIRLIEARNKARKSPKKSGNSTPLTSQNQINSFEELPSAPKRRGRPRKELEKSEAATEILTIL